MVKNLEVVVTLLLLELWALAHQRQQQLEAGLRQLMEPSQKMDLALQHR